MSIQHRYVITPADANLTGFASNVTGATWTLTTTATTDGLAHQVSIKNDSATDHSAKTAALVGTDADGCAQTETINLPAGTATVESTKYFKTLTSVTPSATIGADTMDIGWVDEVTSQTIMLNHLNWQAALVHADVSGTLNYKFQVTAAPRELLTAQEAVLWADTGTSGLTNQTADKLAQLEPLITAARFVLNSYSSGATAVVYVSEAAIER